MTPKRRLAAGLEIAVALMVARGGVIFALDQMGSGRELGFALFRVGQALPSICVTAAVAGILGALIARVQEPFAVRLGGALIVAALFSLLLVGLSDGDATRQVGWDTARGRMAVAACVGAGATLALTLQLRLRHQRESLPHHPWLRIAAPAAVLLAVPLALRPLLAPRTSEMEIVDVVHELLAVSAPGELPGVVVAGRSDEPPSTGVITPSTNFRLRGADMFSLVLPPPASVDMRVPSGLQDLILSARAGIDRSAFDQTVPPDSTIRFDVEIDGELAFSDEIPLKLVGDPPGSSWKLVGGRDGVAVQGGSRLRLSTSVRDRLGNEIHLDSPLRAGFGGMTCEHRRKANRTQSSPTSPNIVLVVMDTERVDRLSAYGYERETTPHLERLAARGVLFEQAHAASSWTWPSTASLLTGLRPLEHGVDGFSSAFLAEAHTTLPELLQRAGFTTAAWSANPLIAPDKNFDQGFESFERGGNSPRQSRTMMPAVLEWLRSVAGTRFFLWVQMMDPHAPLRPSERALAQFASDLPAGFDAASFAELKFKLLEGADLDATVPEDHRRAFNDMYDAGVSSGDEWLGALLDELDALDLTGETLVVFTSDHGEELFERRLAGHSHTLFPELVRVPLVIAGPGVPVGERVASPVSNRHLAPTLAGLAGVALPRVDTPVDLLDPASTGKPASLVFSTTQGWWDGTSATPILGLREGDFVLHWASELDEARLYDVRSDPDMRTDIAAQNPSLLAHMRSQLAETAAALEARRIHTGQRDAGASTEEMLKAIGYLGE